VRFAVLGLVLALGSACTSVHCYARGDVDVRLAIPAAAAEPQRWKVGVVGDTGPGARPDESGRVQFTVPGARFCEWWYLGIFRRPSANPLADPRIHAQHGCRTERVLTLGDIHELPLDGEGRRVVDV
jgi:hypothetical protein